MTMADDVKIQIEEEHPVSVVETTVPTGKDPRQGEDHTSPNDADRCSCATQLLCLYEDFTHILPHSISKLFTAIAASSSSSVETETAAEETERPASGTPATQGQVRRMHTWYP